MLMGSDRRKELTMNGGGNNGGEQKRQMKEEREDIETLVIEHVGGFGQ